MELDLSSKEKKTVIACCENYYDDEVPGASSLLPNIKAKLNRDEDLTLDELKILYQCLDRETHDMYENVENPKSVKIIEEAQLKIQILIKQMMA